MTATTEERVSAPEMEPDAPDLGAAENAATRRAERMRLYVQPVIVLILVAGVLIWHSAEISTRRRRRASTSTTSSL